LENFLSGNYFPLFQKTWGLIPLPSGKNTGIEKEILKKTKNLQGGKF
jgi:hypothetical protein